MAKAVKHSDNVTVSVRAEILSCQLRPGLRLKMAELCDRFGVSLGAVREALSRLTAEGLVVAEPQRGFYVSHVSIEELDDLTDARIEIESLCLTRAIQSGDIDWESRIVSTLYRLKNTAEREIVNKASLQSQEWSNAHSQFHEALVSACENNTLLEVRTSLYLRSERYRRLAMPLDRKGRNTISEHDRIANAVISRKIDKAKSEISKHFKMTAQIIKESEASFS